MKNPVKNLLLILIVAGAMLLTSAAIAGEAGSGFDCSNGCPLAKTANDHRAMGTEAVRVSETVRRDVAAEIVGNLEKI